MEKTLGQRQHWDITILKGQREEEESANKTEK